LDSYLAPKQAILILHEKTAYYFSVNLISM